MSTEIEKRPASDAQRKPGNDAGDSAADKLRPSLDDYENHSASLNPARAKDSFDEKGKSPQNGSLEITPIFKSENGQKSGELAKDSSSLALADRQNLSDKGDSKKDGGEGELNSETQKAKDDFVKILEDRFKDDPRFRDNPSVLKTLEAKLDQMDKRVLNEHVKKADGTEVDQQEQLAKAYRNLSRIGNEADTLTYTAKDGSQRQVYDQPWKVNNILADGIMRGADPVNNYNQGRNNTCATEAINRQGDALLIGEDFQTAADVICNQGKFESVDNAGKPFTCQVDRSSLRLDREAQSMYLDKANARGAFGQITDIRTAQLNLDLISRTQNAQRGEAGGEGRYVYKKVSPTGQGDTGERVVDTARGKVVAKSPCINGESGSNVKQALFGRYIAPNFGKETTLVSEQAFGKTPNVTALRSGEQLSTQLKALEAKGWELPTLATHVGKYVSSARGLSGAEGWHATSIQSGDKGGIDFVNNWGGEHNYKNVNANELFSWTQAPANASAADRQRGDHIFNPDSVYARDGHNPLDADKNELPEHSKGKHDEESKLTHVDKERAKKEEAARKEIAYASAKLAEIEGKLSGLREGDSERSNLLAQKQLYENTLHRSLT